MCIRDRGKDIAVDTLLVELLIVINFFQYIKACKICQRSACPLEQQSQAGIVGREPQIPTLFGQFGLKRVKITLRDFLTVYRQSIKSPLGQIALTVVIF